MGHSPGKPGFSVFIFLKNICSKLDFQGEKGDSLTYTKPIPVYRLGMSFDMQGSSSCECLGTIRKTLAAASEAMVPIG